MYINYLKTKNRLNRKTNKGLTLVELMVVIAIFLMITSVVIFNYGDFSSSISLQNLTDDVALSIRKAQSFAIGARGIDVDLATDKDFTKSYGVHFSTNETMEGSLSGSNRSFLMFSVDSLNKKYTDVSYPNTACGDENECVELFNITTTDMIEGIKAYSGASLISSDIPTSSVDIIFTRPDPRAYICYRATMTDACALNVSNVNITISNGKTDSKKRTKIISVQNTGQISVQ